MKHAILFVMLVSLKGLWPAGPLVTIVNRHHLDRPCWRCVNNRDGGWSDPDITWDDHRHWEGGCSACLGAKK